MSNPYDEYSDLAGTGYTGGSGEKVAPEDEFFHSVYIAGQLRKNHLGIEEIPGKFQVRGVQYNLDEVNMVITHTKEILAKIKSIKGKGDTIECFSFKEGAPPWYGTSKLSSGQARPCPQTSSERAANDFCNPCRAQILVAGIFCDANGRPVLTEEKKPIFIFIRGKGMRYSNVSEYLNNLFKEDLDPVFTPVTEQSKAFEKSVVNNKRFVTKIKRDTAQSSFGSNVNIFVLERGPQLPNDAVLKILKISKENVAKFNEKFDWSKNKGGNVTLTTTPVQGILPVDDVKPSETPAAESSAQEKKPDKTFSFDDIQF
jgi:hypothetical protein